MKKLYSISLVLLMSLLSFMAKADISVVLKVNDAEHITGYIQYYDASYVMQQVTLDMANYVGEGGTIVIPASYGYVYLNTTSGYVFTTLNNSTSSSVSGVGGTSTNFYVYSDATLVAECKLEEEARTEKCTLICDDFNNVTFSRYTGSSIELISDTTTISFMPTGETPFYARHSDYNKTLYQVSVNGSQINASGSQYTIPVVSGDTIRIMSNYPDVDVPVKFLYTEGAENCLSGVTVDGTSVSNYNDSNFAVKLGSKIQINGNTNDYKFNSVKVNGTTVYFYSSYQYTVTDTATQTIEIDATKYALIVAYVTVDDPENVIVYNGYSTSGTPITVEAGVKTAVELNSNNPIISWKASPDCYITSVTYTTTDGTVADRTSSTSVYGVAEGAEFVFVTGKIVRDQEAVIWVDDASQSSYGNSLARYYDNSRQSLVTGDNVINFFEKDNPYSMSWYNPSVSNVYQNQVRLTPMYAGTHNYRFTLADGDTIKVYLASSPEECAISFETGEDLDLSALAVSVAGKSVATTTVADWTAGFTVLKDAVVTIGSIDATLEVYVNDEKVEADDNGVCSFIASEATTVKISKLADAIDVIEVENADVVNVYNLQGILVLKDATKEQLSTLSNGIYIVNGKKTFVRK